MAFVYINGYPAVGKLTVAKELTQVLPFLLPIISLIFPVLLQEAYTIIKSHRQP